MILHSTNKYIYNMKNDNIRFVYCRFYFYRHLASEGVLCDNYKYVIILSEILLPMHKAL